jgi:hypothetical protein
MSEPITLRLVDVIFGEGVPDQSYTLWPADLITFHTNGDIDIEFREKSKELITLRGAHIRVMGIREAEYTPPPDREPGAGPATVQGTIDRVLNR